MKPTMKWWEDIQDEDTYDKLVSTGLAWEWYSDLPLTWQGCLEFKKKYDYFESVKNSNYEASLKISEEEEEKYVKSGN